MKTTNETIIVRHNTQEVKEFLERKKIDYDIRFFKIKNEERSEEKIISIKVTEKEFIVQLEDGRKLSMPII